MPSLLVKVRRKMSISAHKRVRDALEGEYASVFKGRSMDFDDLREYIPGDDVKDIEWKATARSGDVRVKRYVAVRKHNIMLVVDTGRSMAATAPSGESKRDIAVLAAGVLASVAQSQSNLVSLTAGNSKDIYRLPLKGTSVHIERILQYIHTRTTLESPESDLTKVLEYVGRTTKRRLLLVIISDTLQFAAAQEKLLRRMAAQHELLFLSVEDLNPSDDNWKHQGLYDVDKPSPLPSFVRRQVGVETAYQSFIAKEEKKARRLLKKMRISSVRMNSESEVINQVVRLLNEHKHAKR